MIELFPAAGEVPPEHDQGVYPDGRNYLIGGEVRRWAGPTAPVRSVVCERRGDALSERRVIGETALVDGATALEALAAAREAWGLGRGAWPRATLEERIAAIRAFCQAIRPLREEVARLLMWEVGKPWKAALEEFDRTIAYVDDTIAALRDLDRAGGRFQTEGGVVGMVRRAPLGVTLCMGPFNYPLNETYTTLLPALAMGNTAVVKLPKLGMLCNLPLLPALAACFPPGVVNVIAGDGAEVVGPMIRSGQVDVLAFIGSSTVAAIIERQHPAPYRLTTILGMDAKNPGIVLPSADLDLAVREALRGALAFNGQRCTALKLLFVHRSLADAFAERLGAAVEALACGMPWVSGVEITPLPEEHKPAELTRLLEDAVARGARVVNPSGGRVCGPLVAPAVLYPVGPEATLFSVEQFGPLVPIVPYDAVEEVLDAIARSPFGQQLSLFGQDPDEVGPLIDALANQVCRINLNQQCRRGPDTFPFAGRKSSAEGVLSVTEALSAFSLPAVLTAAEDGGRALLEGLLARGASTFVGRRPT